MKLASLKEIDFQKGGGLVPVVARENTTGTVLMLAYADKDAVRLTLSTGFAHYFSRSRGKLWKKGEDSGHVQKVKSVRLDCDGDALVYDVDQTGPACHTGEKTCFFREVDKGGSASSSATAPRTRRLGRRGKANGSALGPKFRQK